MTALYLYPEEHEEPTEEVCDECSGTRWPRERHDPSCSLFDGDEPSRSDSGGDDPRYRTTMRDAGRGHLLR